MFRTHKDEVNCKFRTHKDEVNCQDVGMRYQGKRSVGQSWFRCAAAVCELKVVQNPTKVGEQISQFNRGIYRD